MYAVFPCVKKAFGAKKLRSARNVPRSASDPGSCFDMLASCEPEYTKNCTIRVWNSTGLLLVLSDRHLELIRARYPFWKEGDSFGPCQSRRRKWSIDTCPRKIWPNDRCWKMRMSNIFLMHETEPPYMHARGRDNSKTSNRQFWSDNAPLTHKPAYICTFTVCIARCVLRGVVVSVRNKPVYKNRIASFVACR